MNNQNNRLAEDRVGKRARVEAKERAILAGLNVFCTKENQLWTKTESMNELSSLAKTAGLIVVETVVQNRSQPDPSYFIGKGKANHIKDLAEQKDIDVIVFDDELRPAQARNLEERLGVKVVDRTQIILDIFAQRAQTKEAKLQVELAQYEYLLPRLRGWGESLERQAGGIGTRGPGQTRLDRDREKVQRRIDSIRRKLKNASMELDVRSKRRENSKIPLVTLIGYTNSGKTTLLNKLTGSEGFEEDKLFATLDPLTRKLELPDKRTILLTDTVGLIRKLPHQLIPAFRSTLKSARTGDLLLNLMDATNDKLVARWQVVNKILNEDFFDDNQSRPPMINVLNKSDKLANGDELAGIENEIKNSIVISAKTGHNLDKLKEYIGDKLGDEIKTVSLQIPYAKADLLDWFHNNGEVSSEKYKTKTIFVTGKIEQHLLNKLQSRVSDGELQILSAKASG